MENEEAHEKIARALHPPECPRCGRGVSFTIYKEDWSQVIQYRCRSCFALIAKNADDAVKFLEDEE